MELEEAIALTPHQSAEVLGLDQALDRLERMDASSSADRRDALLCRECGRRDAHVFQISERTVKRELRPPGCS